MNAFQRLTLTGSLALGLLFSVPAGACMIYSTAVVDLSTVSLALSEDGAGWTISFVTPSDAPSNASYIVATDEDSYCTAKGTDLVGDTISCDVPVREDAAQPTVVRIDVVPEAYDPTTHGFAVDASSATVALNGDESGWTITWKTLSEIATGGSYVVTTTDGSICTVDAEAAVEGVASCEVGLLDDPSVAPEISQIRFFPAFLAYVGGPALSVDISTATIVLNADGTGWTVTWSELSADGDQLPYVVNTTTGETCYVTGTGVEGTQLSCDLPLLAEPSEVPTLDSIRTIAFMYQARGALNDGTTSYEANTDIPVGTGPVSTIPTDIRTMKDDSLPSPGGGRSSTWVWITGLVGLLVGSGALLRRKIVTRVSSDA
jgi:hypothetical protein